MIKKADIILAVSIVLLSAVFITATALSETSGGTAIVKVDNKVVAEMPLGTDAERLIETDYGKNTVVIENGEVRVEEADCPDGYCEKHIAISNAGETIACLPHKLVIEIRE